MLLVKLDTGFNIEVEFPISPFHKRLIAWLIDLLTCWLYLIIMAAIFNTNEYWINAIIFLPALFYHLVSEITFNGQSLGKIAMGIKVITEEGGQPTIGQYIIRWVFKLIDLPFWIFLLIVKGVLPWYTMPLVFGGLAFVIFTPKSQRIGDLLAGTILIDLKNRTSWQDTVFTEVEATYQPRYPQVMQLSDRDINTLKSIIETVRKKNDYDLAMKIADRIKSKLKMESDQDSFDFLLTLLKDYNYYSAN